jgi:hypothetical protein
MPGKEKYVEISHSFFFSLSKSAGIFALEALLAAKSVKLCEDGMSDSVREGA